MIEPEFHYTQPGRRPLSLFAAAVSACFLAYIIAGGAPWWVYPPILFAVIGSAYLVFCNPQSGMSIDGRTLTVFSGRWRRTVELADIVGVSIDEYSEGPPAATAKLRDGSDLHIPSMCLPKKAILISVLPRFGLALI